LEQAALVVLLVETAGLRELIQYSTPSHRQAAALVAPTAPSVEQAALVAALDGALAKLAALEQQIKVLTAEPQ
jgi:hypothetical protein